MDEDLTLLWGGRIWVVWVPRFREVVDGRALGSERRRSALGEERLRGRSGDGPQRLREGSPRIPEALGRGSFVWVSARVGNDVSGYVCDSDGSGLLLDIRDPSGDPGGYEFLPWSSIERVRV